MAASPMIAMAKIVMISVFFGMMVVMAYQSTFLA
jgi:hypothetical protein